MPPPEFDFAAADDAATELELTAQALFAIAALTAPPWWPRARAPTPSGPRSHPTCSPQCVPSA